MIAKIIAVLALVIVGTAPKVHAAGQRQAAPAAKPAVEPCNLGGQPSVCGSCPALMAALLLPGAPSGDSGLDADAIAWSPLYVAFRLNCLDAGQLLVNRGANPERGGRQGALLAEISAQHFAVPNSRPELDQAAALRWVSMLAKVRPFDLDAPIGDGMQSTRASWAEWLSAGALPPGSPVIWSRIESLSANFPVLVDGAEWTNVDRPNSGTGITRPSETAVSRGVEAMTTTLGKTGMIGVTSLVSECWSTPRATAWNDDRWRWHLERCAAMDISASRMDKAVSAQLNSPRVEYFKDDGLNERIQMLTRNRENSAAMPQYLKEFGRSIDWWTLISMALPKAN